uniref:Uncharacterized protein n=1 Tax=Caenorhabditis japonica TaxID=281687 RepID=A0A8R1IZ54_CAEJA
MISEIVLYIGFLSTVIFEPSSRYFLSKETSELTRLSSASGFGMLSLCDGALVGLLELFAVESGGGIPVGVRKTSEIVWCFRFASYPTMEACC